MKKPSRPLPNHAAIEIVNTHTSKKIRPNIIRTLISNIAKMETRRPLEYISVVCLGHTPIHRLNVEYLDHDYPTDVLSFDLSLANDQPIAGEIYVNLDKAAEQAKEYSVSYSNEVLRLVAHGFLHILGYNDHTSLQRKKMLELGDRYISKLK